jgi:hypothetical protein
VDFSTVSAIVVFVFMVGVVPHVFMEKMLKKSMEVVAVALVVYGICYQYVIYVV